MLPEQHFTEPPPRYSEASLVKKLEELGIGRPSTYASIIQVLQDRKYVRMDNRRFIPEDRGRVVIAETEPRASILPPSRSPTFRPLMLSTWPCSAKLGTPWIPALRAIWSPDSTSRLPSSFASIASTVSWSSPPF